MFVGFPMRSFHLFLGLLAEPHFSETNLIEIAASSYPSKTKSQKIPCRQSRDQGTTVTTGTGEAALFLTQHISTIMAY